MGNHNGVQTGQAIQGAPAQVSPVIAAPAQETPDTDTGLTDSQFKSLFATTPAASAAHDIPVTELPPEQFKAMMEAPQKAGAVSEQNMFTPLKATWDYISNKFESGEADVVRGGKGIDAMMGHTTYDEIQHDASLDHLKQVQAQESLFESALGPTDARRWVGSAVESIPFMRDTVLGGAKGAFLGAGVGAGIGAVGGIETGPGEALTVPAGALIGARWGYMTGEAVTAAKISTGQMYLDLLDRGADPEHAKLYAIAGGATVGFIQTLGLNAVGSVGRAAIVKTLASESGRIAVGNFIGRFLKNIGIQIGAAELQEITRIVTESAIGVIDKHPGVAPSQAEIQKRLIETFWQSAGTAAVMVGASEAGGHLVGGVIKQVQGRLAPTTEPFKPVLNDAFDLVQESLKEPILTKEELAGAKEKETGDILDELHNPAQATEREPLLGRIQEIVHQALKPPEAPETDLQTPEVKARKLRIEEEMHILDKDVAAVDAKIKERDYDTAEYEARTAQQRVYDINQHIAGLEKKFTNKDRTGRDNEAVTQKLEAAYLERAQAERESKKADRVLKNTIKGPTQALETRREKLLDKRALLETEHALIREGLATPEDIRNAYVKMKAGDLISLRAKAMKKMLKNFQLGVKAGIKYHRDEVQMVQTGVVSLIRDSDLAAKDKAKFLTTIKNIQTQAQLQRRLPEISARIEAMIQHKELKEADADLQKVFKQIKLKRSGKHAESKFRGEVALSDTEQRYYHGTNAAGLTKESLSSDFTQIDGLFGRGVYTTDSYEIAAGYAKARAKRSGAPIVYSLKLNLKNVLDLERPAPPAFREAIQKAAAEWDEQWNFLEDETDFPAKPSYLAKLLQDPSATPEKILLEFTEEISVLSHQEGYPQSEFEDTFNNFENNLSQAGYDALTHTGGKRTGKPPHKVVIILNPQENPHRVVSLEEAVAPEVVSEGAPISGKVQKVLETYKELIENPLKRDAAIARTAEALFEDEKALTVQIKKDTPGVIAARAFTRQQEIETAIAQRVGDWENKTAEERRAVIAEMREIMETGRAQAVEQAEATRDARKALIAETLKSIQGVKPLETLQQENSPERLNKRGAKAKRWLKTVGRTGSGWKSVLQIVSQDDPNHEMINLWSVHEQVTAEDHNITETQNHFVGMLQAVKEIPWHNLLKMLVQGSEVKDWGEYDNQDGKTVHLFMSANEKMKLWAQLHDPDLIRGLTEGNGYTFPDDVQDGGVSLYELVDRETTPIEKQVVKVIGDFYDWYFPRLNDTWQKMTGASLKKNDLYSGMAKRSGFEEGEQFGFLQEQFSRSSIKPSSAIARVENAHALVPSDIFTDVFKHIQAVEHYVAWHEKQPELRAAIVNKDIRNAIELKFGKGMLRTLDDRFNSIVGLRLEQQMDALKWLDYIRRNAGTALVGAKPQLFFRHLTVAFRYLQHVSGPSFVKGSIDFLLHPKSSIETLSASRMVQEQHRLLADNIMGQLASSERTALQKGPTFKEMMLSFVTAGVKASTYAGGWAVYRDVLEKTGSKEEAMRAFEESTKEIQYSGTRDSRSQIEDSGPFGRFITLYLKYGMQVIEREIADIRDAVVHPGKDTAYKAVRSLLINRVAAVLAQASVSAFPILTGDSKKVGEEERKVFRAAFLGVYNEIPLIGDLVTGLATMASNAILNAKDQVREPSSLYGEAMSTSYTLLRDAYKEIHEGGVKAGTLFDLLHAYANSLALVMPAVLGGGEPIGPVIDFLDWITTGGHEKRKEREKALKKLSSEP
jgi:hypothetical protein